MVAGGIIAAIIGAGLWLGHWDDASKTPCERYAALMDRMLDNCHSGQSRDLDKRIAECEQWIDPSRNCLRRIEDLSCEALEQGPVVSAGEVCRRDR
jgi:hypothetical protein